MTLLAHDTVADLAEFITHHNREAKRVPAVIGTADYPSKWDRLHLAIDDALDDYFERMARDRAPA